MNSPVVRARWRRDVQKRRAAWRRRHRCISCGRKRKHGFAQCGECLIALSNRWHRRQFKLTGYVAV